MKKNSNNDSRKFPFADETKEAKYHFKKMIDEMPDEEFMLFVLHFLDYIQDFDDFYDGDYADDFDPFDDDNLEELPF